MIELFALLVLAIFGALLFGQAWIVLTAIRQREAGLGRFTYKLDEKPIGFWVMLLLETAALLCVAFYLLRALGIIAT